MEYSLPKHSLEAEDLLGLGGCFLGGIQNLGDLLVGQGCSYRMVLELFRVPEMMTCWLYISLENS